MTLLVKKCLVVFPPLTATQLTDRFAVQGLTQSISIFTFK